MNSNVNYVEVLKNCFEQNEWNFELDELRDGDVMFTLPFGAKNLPDGIHLKIIVETSDNCKILTYLAREISDNKRAAMLEVLNELNFKYRYLKLVLDSDSDVAASYDFSFYGDEEAAAQAIQEMIFLVKKSMDESIPKIMKVIWSDNDD